MSAMRVCLEGCLFVLEWVVLGFLFVCLVGGVCLFFVFFSCGGGGCFGFLTVKYSFYFMVPAVESFHSQLRFLVRRKAKGENGDVWP